MAWALANFNLKSFAMRSMFPVLVLAVLLTQACVEKKKESQTASVSETETPATSDNDSLPFPVYDYAGLEPLLRQENDTTYIVNFWATWCKPCIEEMPHFEKTYAERKSEKVALVFVSLDMPSMWQKRLVPFVEKKGLKGQVVILDDTKMNDWIPKIAPDWGGGIPATLIYNRDQRQFYEQGFTYETLNTELEKFIR